MWVVWNRITGESTEDMRFGSESEARAWINENLDPDYGNIYAMRHES